MRRLALGAVAAGLLILGGALVFRNALLRHAILPYALSKLESESGLSLRIESAEVTLNGVVTLEGLEGRGGPDLLGLEDLRAERIEVAVRPFGFLAGGLSWLGPIEVRGLRLSINPERGPFLPASESKAPGAGGIPWPLPDFAILGAEVALSGARSLTVRGIDLRQSSGELRVSVHEAEGLPAALEALLGFPLEMEMRARGSPWTFERLEFAFVAAESGEALPLLLHGAARVDLACPEAPEILLEGVSIARGRSTLEASGSSRSWPPRFDPLFVRLSSLELEDLRGLLEAPESFGLLGWGEVWLAGDVSDLSSISAEGRIGCAARFEGADELWDLSASLRVESSCLFVDGARLEGPGFGAEWTGEADLWDFETARLSKLEGSIAGEPFRLVREAPIARGEEGLQIGPFQLIVSAGTIEGRARYDPSGVLESTLVAPDFSAGYLAERLGFPVLREGRLWLGLAAASEPHALWPPRELDLDAWVERGAIALGGRRYEDVSGGLAASLRDGTIRVEEGRARAGGAELEFRGRIPLEALPLGSGGEDAESSKAEVSFRAALPDLESAPIPRGLFRDIEGRAAISGVASGSFAGGVEGFVSSLRYSVLAQVSGGELRFFGDLPSAVDLAATIEATEESLRVRSLEGRIGASPFSASGLARLERPSPEGPLRVRDVDFTFRSRGTLLARRSDLRVRGDLDLRWSGPWERTRLEGTVDIARAYYLVDVPLAPARGARLPLELFSLTAPPFASMRLAVAIRSRRGIFVENNLVSTRASADLLLAGTGAYPLLTGYITADEGRARAGNQNLDVLGSVIEFLAREPMNPSLRIALGRRLRGYDVTVTITGSYDAPEVILSSSPPLDPNSLAILVLTGMTPAEVADRGGARVAATEAAMYLGRQIVEGLSTRDPSRERSFLDDLSIQTESAPRGGRSDPLRVEYRVLEGFPFRRSDLFIQGERDMYSDYNLNVGVRFEFER